MSKTPKTLKSLILRRLTPAVLIMTFLVGGAVLAANSGQETVAGAQTEINLEIGEERNELEALFSGVGDYAVATVEANVVRISKQPRIDVSRENRNLSTSKLSDVTLMVEGEEITASRQDVSVDISDRLKLDSRLSDPLDADGYAEGDLEKTADAAIELAQDIRGAGKAQAQAAALPDLTAASLTNDGPHPFPALGMAYFKVTVGNAGAVSATVIPCAIFADDVLQGIFPIESLPAGSSGLLYFSLKGLPEGIHSIKFTINYMNTISESNTTNNNSSNPFTWTGSPDLIVSSFACNETNNTRTLSMPNLSVAATLNISGTLKYRVYSNAGELNNSNLPLETLKNFTVQRYATPLLRDF